MRVNDNRVASSMIKSQRDKESSLEDRISNSDAAKNMTFYGDVNTVGGQVTGLERANQLYGMNTSEIGQNIQDIVARRRAAMEGNDPASTMARSSRNADIRAAQAQGMTPAQVAQLRRSGTQQAAAQDYGAQNAATSEYQDLLGNIAGGTISSEMGYAQLAKAQNSGGGGGGTVICTELHRQGYMDDETYSKDAEYGRYVRDTAIHVYVGYIFLASPIVSIMRKSRLFTNIISYPAMAWANHMAYGNSFVGKIINTVGSFICGVTGKAIMMNKEFKNA